MKRNSGKAWLLLFIAATAAWAFERYPKDSNLARVASSTGHSNQSVPQHSAAQSRPAKIVYVSSARDGVRDIYSMNLDGTGQTRLTNISVATPTGYRIAHLSGQPAFSPDGRRIAFTLGKQLRVMNVDGSSQTQLTDSSGDKYNPVWSADSGKIAFLRFSESLKGAGARRDIKNEICIINVDGSEEKTLTANNAYHLFPTFNDDGSKIAFISSSTQWWTSAMVRPDKIDKIALSVINTDGSGQTRLHDQAAVDQPRFGPDGKQIVFSVASSPLASSHIGLINADGTAFTPLTKTSGVVLDTYSIGGSKGLTICQDKSPVFSPDGSKIVFVSTRDGKSQIYEMNRDGSRQTRLSDGRGPDISPMFSPNGQHIVFTSLRDYREDGQFPVSNKHEEIYIMKANGSSQKRLTKTWLYFSRTEGLDLSKLKQRAPSRSPEVR